jgi:hypothetical protein
MPTYLKLKPNTIGECFMSALKQPITQVTALVSRKEIELLLIEILFLPSNSSK